MKKNAFYAQSGGVTSVINASACGVIDAVLNNSDKIGTLYAGRNGILGALHEELIDVRQLSTEQIAQIRQTPGGAFGSCRFKLKSGPQYDAMYRRIIDVFKAHDIGYFFYNGGGDSQDTADKIATFSRDMGYPIVSIGVPKTIDNDLPFTDSCPGFGSVAKYVAISTLEASLDVASMAESSTKVFILEVMGRHTGWIAASAGLIKQVDADPPHIILFPERVFDEQAFCDRVAYAVKNYGYCTIVTSEGIRNSEGAFLSERGTTDSFGHKQLGGVAPVLAQLIQEKLGYKYHWAVSDYLQRAARHIASGTDTEQAYALGQHAVALALSGKNACMPIVVRDSDKPYRWHLSDVPLSTVANQERPLPDNYIDDTGFAITPACLDYLSPLIQGEAYPTYTNGLPNYARIPFTCVEAKLPKWKQS
ncbi:MAG: 6-phosphofructokinase [Pseudomonadota bacterium]